MDRNLSFVEHVNHVVAKCSGALIALMHAKHSLPKASIKPIVNSLVISSVRYCISVYGTCSKTEKDRIHKIINFAARVISGRRKYDQISDVIKKFNWLSVPQLVTYHRTSLVHKIVSTGQPESLFACLTASDHQHDHDTRQSSDMRLPRVTTDVGKRQIAYSGVQFYNTVRSKMRGRPFKTALHSSLRPEPG